MYHHLFWVSRDCCLQIKAFILLAFLLLPTHFCLFCSLFWQLVLSLYTRVLRFLFPLLCLPLRLEISHQLLLFPLLLTKCKLLSASGNLVFLRLVFIYEVSLILLRLSSDQHLYLLHYRRFFTFSLHLKLASSKPNHSFAVTFFSCLLTYSNIFHRVGHIWIPLLSMKYTIKMVHESTEWSSHKGPTKLLILTRGSRNIHKLSNRGEISRHNHLFRHIYMNSETWAPNSLNESTY